MKGGTTTQIPRVCAVPDVSPHSEDKQAALRGSSHLLERLEEVRIGRLVVPLLGVQDT